MVEWKTSASEDEIANAVARNPVDFKALLEQTRRAQREWANVPLSERLRCVRRFRDLLARDAQKLIRCFSQELERTRADTLVAEIIPLAEAARFLERTADDLLRVREVSSRGRPFWLRKVEIQLRREPLGIVLVIGPSNYPLFLPGVQALQALVAGNAVWMKPGHGGRTVTSALRAIAVEAGIPPQIFVVLDEGVENAQQALRAGLDKVVLTGSVQSGTSVLREAAEQITPAIVELSGCDAVFVREDADISKAVRAVVFGLTLNGGATCIAPRRIFVHRSVAEGFERALRDQIKGLPPARVSSSAASLAGRLIRDALRLGAELSTPYDESSPDVFYPVLILKALPGMELMRSDVFAPVIAVMRVDGDDEAIGSAGMCPYALGATIFGEEAASRRFAERVSAGVVVVNDMIVPTADPRLPFGGAHRSGFGKTRGAEGLLEMTHLKAIVVQHGKRLRHLEPAHPHAEDLFLAFLAATHRRNWTHRLHAWKKLGNVMRRS
jgi:acyl-CoA reductase-like NAD-dependent aldehyde dehydrogenase